jgi:eukaryotic-like serine/threonine-protein kinase
MTFLDDNSMDRLKGMIDWPDLSGTSYRLVGKIATGGMGTVFLVEDDRLKRQVALKVLTIPDNEGTLSERMMREAQTVARLEHPGIVPVHEVGRLPDGRVFYTMKYVEGMTLREHARADGDLPAMLRFFQRVCEAVAFAHARGVVHRDIKPSNIMLGQFGEVLVMDWGIASWAGELQPTTDDREHADVQTPQVTAPGAVVGTPAYMAPEQARGDVAMIDHRADIYSLGAVLYYILSGCGPFDAMVAESIRNAVVFGQFPEPRQLNRKVNRRLNAICVKAMHTDREQRYQSASDMSNDIARWLDGNPVTAYRDSVWERVSRWIGRHQFIVMIILAYILVRFVVLFWLGY